MCWSTEVIIIGAISRKTIKKLCSTILKAAILWWSTVFVRISAHPPHRHRGGSTRLFTYWLEWQWDWNWNWISTNKRLPRRRRFLQSILQKPCFVTSLRFVTTIYCFVAKYTYYTYWKWWKFSKRSASNKRPVPRSKKFNNCSGRLIE